MNLILASASPRRRELLAATDLPFTVAEKFACEEVWPADLPVERVAEYLSALKSNAYPIPLGENDVLLTADTTVIVDNRILGKPLDKREAVEMLTSLSGREHAVVTGVTLRTSKTTRSFSVRTAVWFRALSKEEIEYYVSKYRPLDKAGAYGIQEWIGHVGVERIEGSFFNVMGLPVQKVYAELQKL